jgi:hypothetical protein
MMPLVLSTLTKALDATSGEIPTDIPGKKIPIINMAGIIRPNKFRKFAFLFDSTV